MIFFPILGSYPSVCAVVASQDHHGIGVPRGVSRIAVWNRHVPPLTLASSKELLSHLPA